MPKRAASLFVLHALALGFVFAESFDVSALAAAKSGADLTALLAAPGADVNAPGDEGGTALVWASRGDNAGAVKLLVARGADKNAADNEGEVFGIPFNAYRFRHTLSCHVLACLFHVQTALMWAVRWQHEAVMKLLLEAEADITLTHCINDWAHCINDCTHGGACWHC